MENLRALGAAQRVERPRREWTRRRVLVFSVIAAATALVLAVGGVSGYRILAPYWGQGYHTGGAATIESVRFTVTHVDCGLRTPPFGDQGRPRGNYCGVTVTAANHSRTHTAFVDPHTWTSRLDVDLTVRPVSAFLPTNRLLVNTGQRLLFELTYDIPDGARMLRVNLKVDNITRPIPVS